MTIRTGGDSVSPGQSGLRQLAGPENSAIGQSGSPQLSGCDSGLMQQAGSDDNEGTRLDVQNFDSLRGQQLSDDPIESFTCVGDEQLSDPISSFDDVAAYGFGPESDLGYDPSLGSADQDCDRHANVDIHDTLIDSTADVASIDHDATQSRLEQSLEPQRPKFMWEESSFLSTVFGNGNVADDLFPVFNTRRPPRALVDLTGEDTAEPPIKRALRLGKHNPYFLRATKQSTVMHEDSQRQTHVNGWVSIVLLNIEAFSAFDVVLLARSGAELRVLVRDTVVECLARKATSTVGKRLGSIRAFAEFCAEQGCQPFPLEDVSMHSYLTKLLHDAKTAGSKGKSFLESIRFSGATLGLRSIQGQLVSLRVAGVAEQLMKRAPIIEQAKPFTVEQIQKLERECCCCDSLQDRAILGAILVMVFGSARVSDMARAVKLLIDRDSRGFDERRAHEPAGYIELGILGNKGARRDAHRRMLLPIVAPMLTLSQSPWWDSWLEARMALGLDGEAGLEHPLLCRFDSNGVATKNSMGASEVGSFVREVVGEPPQRRNLLRSHSCKTTVLSWLAKFGVPMPVRRIVGHHLDPAAKSAETYSRDSMSPALRAVAEVVGAINNGSFAPDSTRSGRFLVPRHEKGEGPDDMVSEASYEMPFTDTEALAGDSDDTATDSSSDAGSETALEVDDSTTLWELLRPELRPALIAVPDNLHNMVHKLSGVVHLRKGDSRRLLCGRTFNERYEPRARGASRECPKCTTCFSSRDAQVEE